MRKKLTIGVGLVMLALVVTALVVVMMPPTDPPLRVGMSEAEVDAKCLKPSLIRRMKNVWPRCPKECSTELDFFGNHSLLAVTFDDDDLVESWETVPLCRTRPPWLDRAMKWAGW